MTKAPSQRKKRKKEEGRPKGTYKKYQFEETRLGFMLKYEVPIVFDIIMNMTPYAVIKEPPLLLIRTICSSSKDPSFKKKKFFRYLAEYGETGLCCHRPKQLTPARKTYYEAMRKRKLDRYIIENRERIEILREKVKGERKK